MISEEKQQTIDINKISLPISATLNPPPPPPGSLTTRKQLPQQQPPVAACLPVAIEKGRTSLLKMIDQAGAASSSVALQQPQQGPSSVSIGNKTNLDMRLDLIFGNSSEKKKSNNNNNNNLNVDMQMRKENFNQLEKDVVYNKFGSAKKEVL